MLESVAVACVARRQPQSAPALIVQWLPAPA